MKLRILTVVAATVIAFGSPAEAKGPSALMITGAGLVRPIVVEPDDGRYVLSRIMEASAFFDAASPIGSHRAGGAAVRHPLAGPGPRLRLTWSVEWNRTQHVVQDVYPYASGGPLLYTPAGQRLFDETTPGGWYRAAPRLVDLLRSVGVPSLGELRQTSTAVSSSVRSTDMIIRW